MAQRVRGATRGIYSHVHNWYLWETFPRRMENAPIPRFSGHRRHRRAPRAGSSGAVALERPLELFGDLISEAVGLEDLGPGAEGEDPGAHFRCAPDLHLELDPAAVARGEGLALVPDPFLDVGGPARLEEDAHLGGRLRDHAERRAHVGVEIEARGDQIRTGMVSRAGGTLDLAQSCVGVVGQRSSKSKQFVRPDGRRYCRLGS